MLVPMRLLMYLSLLAAFLMVGVVLWRITRGQVRRAAGFGGARRNADVGRLMAGSAEEAVACARAMGVGLDYSPASVEGVEMVLARLHAERATGALVDADLKLRAQQFGAYVGEVLRREYGGFWEAHSKTAGKNTYPMHWKNHESFPVAWCGKRLLMGAEENVLNKYQVVTKGREG